MSSGWGHSTHPITYLYEVPGPDGAPHQVAVRREHAGTAYARNGNAGNPTEYFTWYSYVDGSGLAAGAGCESRAVAYEYARAGIFGIPYYQHRNYPHRVRGVRSFRAVQAEMQANYRGQRKEQT